MMINLLALINYLNVILLAELSSLYFSSLSLEMI
jgi:hypothetical protein